MTLPERIVYGTLVWTWGIYAFGGLYVAGPVLAWVLAGFAFLALYLGPAMRADLRPTGQVPGIVWLWIAGMFVMLLAALTADLIVLPAGPAPGRTTTLTGSSPRANSPASGDSKSNTHNRPSSSCEVINPRLR